MAINVNHTVRLQWKWDTIKNSTYLQCAKESFTQQKQSLPGCHQRVIRNWLESEFFKGGLQNLATYLMVIIGRQVGIMQLSKLPVSTNTQHRGLNLPFIRYEEFFQSFNLRCCNQNILGGNQFITVRDQGGLQHPTTNMGPALGEMRKLPNSFPPNTSR